MRAKPQRFSFNPIFSAYFNAAERRLVVRSVIIGALVWAFVFALRAAINWSFYGIVHWVEAGPSLWLMLVPLAAGALGMAFFSHYHTSTVQYRDSEGKLQRLRDVDGDGLERAIALFYTSEPALEKALLGREGVEVRWQLPTFSLAIRKALATFVTLGSGASGGLAASAGLIGESIASGLFKPRHRGEQSSWLPSWRAPRGIVHRFWLWWRSTGPDDLQTAQLCGIAAAIATLLGAPFAAAFFAVEVMYRRRPVIEKLLYALLSALVAFFLSSLFAQDVTMFEIRQMIYPPVTVEYYGLLVLLAVVISQMGVYFSSLRTQVSRFFRSGRFNDWQRNLAGFMLTGVIGVSAALFTGRGLDLVLGTGQATIDAALAGELTLQVALIAGLAKMLATLSTVGAGGSAGLLVPSIFLGSMIASALASFFGLEPMQLIIPAVTASLVSIVNVPIAATLLVVELFGSAYLVPSLVVLVLTLILTHRSSIYRTQREYEEKREILPGYSVRRVAVPSAWAGQTISDLRIRTCYGLNVIGLMEHQESGGYMQQHLALNPKVDRPLQAGDMLLLLGEDHLLDQFAADAMEIT